MHLSASSAAARTTGRHSHQAAIGIFLSSTAAGTDFLTARRAPPPSACRTRPSPHVHTCIRLGSPAWLCTPPPSLTQGSARSAPACGIAALPLPLPRAPCLPSCRPRRAAARVPPPGPCHLCPPPAASACEALTCIEVCARLQCTLPLAVRLILPVCLQQPRGHQPHRLVLVTLHSVRLYQFLPSRRRGRRRARHISLAT